MRDCGSRQNFKLCKIWFDSGEHEPMNKVFSKPGSICLHVDGNGHYILNSAPKDAVVVGTGGSFLDLEAVACAKGRQFVCLSQWVEMSLLVEIGCKCWREETLAWLYEMDVGDENGAMIRKILINKEGNSACGRVHREEDEDRVGSINGNGNHTRRNFGYARGLQAEVIFIQLCFSALRERELWRWFIFCRRVKNS
ncbi:uncharacterized protein LOC113292834 [Papaver somniferum]|uniref:uncharacterized protein LOC113292834 n=1 Tax=Papaver somniferum TaxID=3469 RepID=UPI000E6F6B4A|nr:uncharacterized protein LOC113292834 [Papaver somniferum]